MEIQGGQMMKNLRNAVVMVGVAGLSLVGAATVAAQIGDLNKMGSAQVAAAGETMVKGKVKAVMANTKTFTLTVPNQGQGKSVTVNVSWGDNTMFSWSPGGVAPAPAKPKAGAGTASPVRITPTAADLKPGAQVSVAIVSDQAAAAPEGGGGMIDRTPALSPAPPLKPGSPAPPTPVASGQAGAPAEKRSGSAAAVPALRAVRVEITPK